MINIVQNEILSQKMSKQFRKVKIILNDNEKIIHIQHKICQIFVFIINNVIKDDKVLVYKKMIH